MEPIMFLIDELKRMFTRPSAEQSMLVELENAEHALLEAETGVEYASSMVAYNKARIKRLRTSLNKGATA